MKLFQYLNYGGAAWLGKYKIGIMVGNEQMSLLKNPTRVWWIPTRERIKERPAIEYYKHSIIFEE